MNKLKIYSTDKYNQRQNIAFVENNMAIISMQHYKRGPQVCVIHPSVWKYIPLGKELFLFEMLESECLEINSLSIWITMVNYFFFEKKCDS